MSIPQTILRTLAVLTCFYALMAASQSALTQKNEKHFDKHSVYYTVFNSTFVQADIAKQYGLKRSPYELLINVLVSKKNAYGGIPATVSGSYTNLLQQQKSLNFITIQEKDTVYYLAPLRISGKEVAHFDLHVIPNESKEPLNIKFTKTLYSDDAK